jgi:hypothetical protein
VLGDPHARGQRQQVEQRQAQRAADVLVDRAVLAARQPLEGEHRIRQPRRLRRGGRSGVGLRQQRVQRRVRRKRDAHRVVGGQRGGEQPLDFGGRRAPRVVRRKRRHWRSERVLRKRLQLRAVVFDRKRRAPCEQEGGGRR